MESKLRPLCIEMFEMSTYKSFITLNESWLFDHFEAAQRADDQFFSYDENGFFWGQCGYSFMSNDVKLGQEKLWYSRKGGLRLYREFTNWCISKDCAKILLTTQESMDKTGRVEKMYDNLGYTLVEKIFIKDGT